MVWTTLTVLHALIEGIDLFSIKLIWTDVGEAEAKKYLKDSGNDVKVAIVTARKQLDQETARNFLNHHHGYLCKILNEI